MDIEIHKELFRTVAEELSFESKSTFREEYSGRGMLGKTCFAIVSDVNPISIGLQFMICGKALDMGVRDIMKVLPTRQDDMGQSTIYY